MIENKQNVIVDEVLSQDEISQIYDSLKISYRQYVMQKYGQQVSDFWMPDSALRKIIGYCEKITGVSGLKLEAYQFSRYEKFTMEDGTVSYPNLTPHFDTFPESRFTFDYQISGNTSWSIFVEGKEFELKNNQALTFAGTHQIHWRPKKVFTNGEYIDMIFCHLSFPNDELLPEEHAVNMKNKENKAIEEFGELPWKM